MVSGSLGKKSRLCHPPVFRYADYFCSLPPSFVPLSLGALDTCPSCLPLDPSLDGRRFAGISSRCMTGHSGQISLLSSAGREMSTGQGEVAVL